MWRIAKRIIQIGLIITMLLVLSVGWVGYDYYQKVLDERPLVQTMTYIQEQDDYIKLEDISPNFINGIIAVEDRRFLTHNGFDFISIVRAALTNIASGQIVQGGSTITQQLAKNVFFTSNQTFLRKSAELFMAFAIERHYTKEEILELYSNIIYLGNGYYGVEAAAQGYFNTSAYNLTVEEAAFIAGLPQAPSVYSTNTELGIKRQQVVLQALRDMGYITD